MHKLQRTKILDLLKEREWVCVEQMTQLYIVDYRRRLKDLEEIGHKLESRRCTQHTHHRGGSKEWRLVEGAKRAVYDYILGEDGIRHPKLTYVPI
jgi:hypothetical protein